MLENLTQSISKLIKSLQQKKYRDAEGLFVVEGRKMVAEAAEHGDTIRMVVSRESGIEDFSLNSFRMFKATEREMQSLSSFTTAPGILAVCAKMIPPPMEALLPPGFVLDGISDPGNLGTLLRICDWFGIKQLVCAHSCVDLYNPKVVQASMGSIFRVGVVYCDLADFLKHQSLSHPILGAHMKGKSVFDHSMAKNSWVVLGSESHGISPELTPLLSGSICIPRFGGGESLNVASAASIIAAELRRPLPT